MRWFTHKLEYGPVNDVKKHDARRAKRAAQYCEHIERLRPELPVGLALHHVAGGFITLHDATFISASERGRTVVFDLSACSVLGGSEVDLHLRFLYTGAEVVRPRGGKGGALNRRLVHAHPEVLFEEFDRAKDGRFEHRILLWPEKAPEVIVRFADVQIVAVEFAGAAATLITPDDPRLQADDGGVHSRVGPG
jgi:hypothetical protein